MINLIISYSFKVISKLEDIGIKTLDGIDVKSELGDYHFTLLREIRDNRKQDEESISDEDAINEFGEPHLDDINSIDDGINEYDEVDEFEDYPMDIN